MEIQKPKAMLHLPTFHHRSLFPATQFSCHRFTFPFCKRKVNPHNKIPPVFAAAAAAIFQQRRARAGLSTCLLVLSPFFCPADTCVAQALASRFFTFSSLDVLRLPCGFCLNVIIFSKFFGYGIGVEECIIKRDKV